VRIDLHPRFRKRTARLEAAERDQVAETLSALLSGFGHPHLHTGRGIRRLRKNLFECRAGLHWRIVFLAEKNVLTAYDLMRHDEIRAWLRTL
jgi:hypothetical protein